VRVWLYCNRTGYHFLADPLERERFIIELDPKPRVRVDDRGILQVFEQPLLCCHRAPEFDLHTCPVDPVPLERMFGNNVGFVCFDFYLNLELMRRFLCASARDDNRRKTACQLRVKDGSGDPDPLLSARLPDLVEPGPVQEFAEDKRHLCRDDAGPIILDDDPENVNTRLFDTDVDIRKHLRFLAGVERVIDCFLDGRDHTARGRIESKQVFVLLEKFRDTDTTLPLCELVSEHHMRSPRLLPRQGQGFSVQRCAGS
jgi:hypothetical protein